MRQFETSDFAGTISLLPARLRAGVVLVAALALCAGCSSDEPGGDASDTSTTDASESDATGVDATGDSTGDAANDGGDDVDARVQDDGTDDVQADAAVDDCTFTVSPDNDNDQQTLREVLIDEAQAGDIVCLEAATYSFRSELGITVDGLTLRGAGREETTLDFADQDLGANGILITADNVSVEDFQLVDSAGDGIRANDVRNIRFSRVGVIWTEPSSTENGAYGLYPVGSEGVLMEDCVAVGASDAGIYVGQSRFVLIRNNTAHGNVAGIESENSNDVEIVGNHAHDNTAGILLFNLPGPPVQGGQRTLIHDNLVENNNLPNFGEEGAIVSSVPPGIGLATMAADYSEVTNNTITGNVSAGYVQLAYSTTLFGPHDNAAFEMFNEGHYVHDNTFENNGTSPRGLFAAIVAGLEPEEPGAELVMDTCIWNHDDPPAEPVASCMVRNGDARWVGIEICGLSLVKEYDASLVDCTGDTQSTQTGVVE